MSFEFLNGLNWLAVIVAAVAWFAFGALWYAPPVMGKAWAQASGIEIPEDQKPNPAIFLFTLVAYFIASVVTAVIAAASGTDTIGEGLALGLMLGVGYAVTAAMVSAVYEMKPKPTAYIVVNGVYNLIGLTIVSVIVALWR